MDSITNEQPRNRRYPVEAEKSCNLAFRLLTPQENLHQSPSPPVSTGIGVTPEFLVIQRQKVSVHAYSVQLWPILVCGSASFFVKLVDFPSIARYIDECVFCRYQVFFMMFTNDAKDKRCHRIHPAALPTFHWCGISPSFQSASYSSFLRSNCWDQRQVFQRRKNFLRT